MANGVSIINVHIARREAVSTEAVSRISSQFLEWLESVGFTIEFPVRYDTEDYESMGILFAKNLMIEKKGQLR